MNPGDAASTARIEAETFFDPWPEMVFRQCIKMGYEAWVVSLGPQLIGYGILAFEGLHAHILNLCIRPGFRGVGLGRRLLLHLLDLARSRARSVYLEVRISNQAAQQLYSSLGFRQTARIRDYYLNATGREDALVLQLGLDPTQARQGYSNPALCGGTMTDSFRLFMAGLIDYAGLFPPAKLPMREAVTKFLSHRTEPEGWVMARFICLADRLRELGEELEKQHVPDSPIPLSVVVGPAFRESLGTAFETLDEFGARMDLEFFEVRLNSAEPDRDAEQVLQVVSQRADRQLRVFFELPSPLPGSMTVGRLLEKLLSWRSRGLVQPGLKLRCGGETADAFPSEQVVAGIVRSAVELGLPLKATAGLHHPVRHFRPELRVWMHGFLNLFAAGIFCSALSLQERELLALVSETDESAFRFGPVEMHWRNFSVPLAEIQRARQGLMISFGSCSFDEPREDLMKMGLLDETTSSTGTSEE